jgi:uncharacterized membrane protein
VRASSVGLWILGVGVVAWTALLFLAPDLLFPIGSFICHQRPERSFFLHGRQLPVCARCTGLYLGAAMDAPVALFAATALAARSARAMFAIAALPTAITWTVEFAGLAHFSNVARFATAVPLGSVAAWLVLGELRGHREPLARRAPRKVE